MSAFATYICRDAEAGPAESEGDDTQGSDRASDGERDHVDPDAVYRPILIGPDGLRSVIDRAVVSISGPNSPDGTRSH